MSEDQRLIALHQLAILDTPSEERFDRIARLAAHLFDCPMAYIGFVDADRAWAKSIVGITIQEKPRELSFCNEVVARASNEPVVVADVRLSPFEQHPAFVTEPKLRFYAGQPLLAPDGSRVGVICAFDVKPHAVKPEQVQGLKDLAALVEAELDRHEIVETKRRLETSERHLRALIDPNPDAVYTIDPQGRFMTVNDATLRITGYSREEMVGRPFDPLLAPEDRDETQAYFQRCLNGEPQYFRIRLVRKDGSDCFVAVSLSPYEIDGKREGVVGISRDITTQIQAERALLASEQRYRNLFQHSLDGLILTDATGRILDANPAACRLLGRSEDALARLSREDVLTPLNAATKDAFEERARQGAIRCEAVLRRADGSVVPVDTNASRFRKETGEERILIVVCDISERKRAEAELAASHEELRSLTASLQSLQEIERRRLAHELHDELGQYLTAFKFDIAWMLGRLATGAVDALESKLHKMNAAAEAVIESVRRLVRTLRPMLLDELGLAAACEWLAQDFTERTGIPCRLYVDPDDLLPPEPVATAVFRVVQEALTNVSRHASAQHVKIELRQHQAMLTVVVRDDGIGIADMTRHTGFGLISMRERVHVLGGSLDIDTKPGGGVCISAELPVATTEQERL